MGIEGYDNVKKNSSPHGSTTWALAFSFPRATYDPATKTFTYTSEIEADPGNEKQVREVMKIADNNHMALEWYENRGGKEMKTMEINYTRAGKK